MKLPRDIDRYLKPLVIVLIVLWCGPEVFAVVELTTLLELLGATLFMFAFGTSFKALALSIFEWAGSVVLPVDARPLINARAGLGALLVGLRLVLQRNVMLLVVCITPYLILSDLLARA